MDWKRWPYSMAFTKPQPYTSGLLLLGVRYNKNIVYRERITDISHLKRQIIAAIETVTPDMLFKTWEEIDYRLDVCKATNFADIET